MDKNQREVRLRQEDADLNRGLLWVVGAVLLECLLMVVNRWYINFYPAEIGVAEAILNVMRVLRLGGGVVGILALVWAALCFHRGGKAGWPAVVGLVLLALAVRKIVSDRLHHRSDCSTGVCSGDCAHCHMQH